MLKVKIVSSQEKIFIDNNIDDFSSFESVSALSSEVLNFQFIYVDEGDTELPVRPICKLTLEGELAPYATVRDVRSVPVERPTLPGIVDSNYLRMTPGVYPDVLTPLRYGGKVAVGKDKLRSLWIEVRIPEGYSGESTLNIGLGLESGASGDTAVLLFDGTPIASASLEINVIDAALPEAKLLFTQWFYADCLAGYYRVPVWSERHWEIVESFAKVAIDRGRNMLYTPLLTPALNVVEPYERTPCQLVSVEVVDGKYFFDFTNVDRWVDMCDRIGAKYLEIAHFYDQHKALHSAKVYGVVDGEQREIFGWQTASDDPEYVRFLREMISAFLEHMRARGDDKRCVFHIADEPNIDDLERFLKIKNNIADLLDGYVIMDALSDIEFYNNGAVTEPVPVTTHAMPFIEAGVPDLWVYYACNQVVDYSNCYVAMPSWRTRSIGMQLYKYNVKGFLHWGFNFYNNRCSGDVINPYLDLSGEDWVPAGDTFAVYPGTDGTPLESIRIMTLEEAIQDVRAMCLAEKYYSHEEVVRTMEEALGDEITFERCARSADEMLRVRAAVNGMIEAAVLSGKDGKCK